MEGYKTSLTLLNDLIESIKKGQCDNDVSKYFKGDNDAALSTLKNKIEIIKNQELNKDCFVVYADTNRLKSSFNYPNMCLYNYILLNDDKSIDFIVNNIDKYNFTEHNYTNYSRIFFDIDFKDMNEIDDLKKLFELIHELQDKYNLKAYGICEINSKMAEYDFILDWPEDDEIHLFSNDKIEKLLSGHIYLNGYCERYKLMNYMKYLKNIKGLGNTFDISVYKTTKQPLRMSYSPKIETDKARYISKKLIDYVKNNKDIIKNLRMAPCDCDKLVDLPEVEKFVKSSTMTKYENGEPTSSNKGQQKDKSVSILQYINYDTKFENIKDIASSGFITSCYELSQKYNLFKSLPLTVEEFNEEWNNVEFEEFEGLEGLKAKTLDYINYKQDYKNDKTLYIYKNYLYKYYEKLGGDLKDVEDEEAQTEEMKTVKKIINKYNYYIEKYEKYCFVNHEFYDVNDYKDGLNKYQKIHYNCYKTVENEKAVYYPFKNITFGNITQFRNYFKLNGQKANDIFDNLVCYMNQKEYIVMDVENKYRLLKSDKIEHYNTLINDFVELFRKTFIHEQDFKYYLSYYANKLKYKTTLNKGIINQGTETKGAHNSLKTYFNDLLNNYLNIVSGDVNNINKALNGGYFEGDLLVIEETPKNIKDVTNFINVLKMYSSKKNITIEKKGMNPMNIINNSDTVINTNHTTSTLFYNKNDCEALIKRFKIIQRQSLSNETLKDNKTLLDEFSNNEVLKYMFMLYIKNYDTNVFYDYKDVYNNVELLYINSSCEENEVDKIQTDMSFDVWFEFFKANYQNKNNYLIVSKFLERLGKNETFKNMKQKTFKAMIIRLLTEESNESVKIDDNGHIVMTRATRDDYMKIYKHFYIYVENNLKTEEDKETDNVEL